MVRKNPQLKPSRNVIVEKYVCDITLEKAIESIYPDWKLFNYPHGEPGTKFPDGNFISFNGRVGTIIYSECDFTDKKNVPLSKQNRDDLLKLGLLKRELK